MCAENDHNINSIVVSGKVESSPNGRKECMTYALICTKCGYRFEDITEQSTADTIRSIK